MPSNETNNTMTPNRIGFSPDFLNDLIAETTGQKPIVGAGKVTEGSVGVEQPAAETRVTGAYQPESWMQDLVAEASGIPRDQLKLREGPVPEKPKDPSKQGTPNITPGLLASGHHSPASM